MGKGSVRRPEDTEAVRRNWPFGDPLERATEPVIQTFQPISRDTVGWCVTCGSPNRQAEGSHVACTNTECVAYDAPRASVSYNPLESWRRREAFRLGIGSQ